MIRTSARVKAFLERQNDADMRKKNSGKENFVLILKASTIEKILKKDLRFSSFELVGQPAMLGALFTLLPPPPSEF